MEDQTYPGKRATTTIEVNAEVLSNFRKAVSTKHDGRIHGFMYIEYNNALLTWTKVMRGEVEIVPKKPRAPVFDGQK